jgi:hypothetical protein
MTGADPMWLNTAGPRGSSPEAPCIREPTESFSVTMPMAHDLPWLVKHLGEAGYWMTVSFFVATKPWLP